MKDSQRRMLDEIVRTLPGVFERTFNLRKEFRTGRGACVTYSRVLADVLNEFGIKARVQPVHIETGNEAAFQIWRGEFPVSKPVSQDWGLIENGQSYQHAVCLIESWNVGVDLAMERRESMMVPSVPYWLEIGGPMPSWMHRFELKSYDLTDYVYKSFPSRVSRAKREARVVIARYREKASKRRS